MEFNSANPETSLYEDALYWSGATSTTYPVDPDFTRNANFAVELITAYIQRADNTWEYQDSNDSSELIDSTTNLTSGTNKYSITASWLKITRVRIKDANGNWITLKPVNRRQVSDSELSSTGTPTKYYKLGNYIFLVGTPNYSQSGGIEVQFQKNAHYFLVGDTDAEPGFAPQFHRLVSLYCALDYTEANDIVKRSQMIRNRIGVFPEGPDKGSGMLRELAIFYGDRDRDGADRLTLRNEDYGASAMVDGYTNNPKGF